MIEYSLTRNEGKKTLEFWSSDDQFYKFVTELVQVAVDATAHRNRVQRIAARISVDDSDAEAFYE